MKKILFTFIAISLASGLMAGGLVTNTNMSASFTRMLCRDATIGVDAVYFNPAGLTKLGNGLHLSVSNQIIGQTKTVTNNFPYLNGSQGGTVPVEYIGKVSAPIFPTVYAAFRMGKLAISAGFNPIGGGGGAEYATGLPSFEMDIASLVPMLSGLGLPTDEYSADVFFEGTSVYFGFQANVSYEINKMLSVALGARYVTAKNTYEGYLKDIMANPTHPLANPNGDMILISPFFTTIGQPIYALATADKEVDVSETGSGITPIISVNISPIDMLNVAIKYEHSTKLELTTEVKDGKDGGGIYVDGEKVVADMPAMLSVGASLNPLNKLLVSAGVHYYFDKNNDYDGDPDVEVQMIDNNFIEYAIGVEYNLLGPLSVSVGYAGTRTGVNDNYQSDLRYSLNNNGFGGGVKLSLTPLVEINLGAIYTIYEEGGKSYNYDLGGIPVPVNETYDTSTWLVAVGVDLHF